MLDQHLAVVEVHFRPVRAKQRSKCRPKTYPVQSTDKSRDILTEALDEVCWKTVLVAGGFSFHTAKLPTLGGLSLLISYFLSMLLLHPPRPNVVAALPCCDLLFKFFLRESELALTPAPALTSHGRRNDPRIVLPLICGP